MNKQELRKIYKEKRKALSFKQRLQFDDLLLLQFQQIDVSNFNNILSFFPSDKLIEPNVLPFSNYLRHFIPQLQLCYPRVNEHGTMDAVLIDEDTIYKDNQYGILEPNGSIIVNPSSLDLIIVPLLAYDEIGYRVGYGKGYYDKYIAQCSADCFLLGVSYFEPEEKIDDVSEYDIPLHICISPTNIYEY